MFSTFLPLWLCVLKGSYYLQLIFEPAQYLTKYLLMVVT